MAAVVVAVSDDNDMLCNICATKC